MSQSSGLAFHLAKITTKLHRDVVFLLAALSDPESYVWWLSRAKDATTPDDQGSMNLLIEQYLDM